jgi:CheY-like chemotaxis protein
MTRIANILIVDDSISSSFKLTKILDSHGYQVSAATSAEDAIPAFTEKEFDVVITEIMLPGMSGLSMMKIIKGIRPDCDVVIVTSNESSYNILKSFRLGAFDFIFKPIDDESVLYNVVERALEKQEQKREKQHLITELTVKNKRLHETLVLMKSVNNLCAQFASTFDTAVILKELTETATEHLQAKRGYLLLLDKSGLNLNLKVCTGIDPLSTTSFKLEIGKGITGQVVSSGKAVVVEQMNNEDFSGSIIEEDPDGVLLASPSIISVPLQVKGRVAGAVTISGGCAGKPFTDEHLGFLSMLSRYASIAIENAGVVHNLKKRANVT